MITTENTTVNPLGVHSSCTGQMAGKRTLINAPGGKNAADKTGPVFTEMISDKSVRPGEGRLKKIAYNDIQADQNKDKERNEISEDNSSDIVDGAVFFTDLLFAKSLNSTNTASISGIRIDIEVLSTPVPQIYGMNKYAMGVLSDNLPEPEAQSDAVPVTQLSVTLSETNVNPIGVNSIYQLLSTQQAVSDPDSEIPAAGGGTNTDIKSKSGAYEQVHTYVPIQSGHAMNSAEEIVYSSTRQVDLPISDDKPIYQLLNTQLAQSSDTSVPASGGGTNIDINAKSGTPEYIYTDVPIQNGLSIDSASAAVNPPADKLTNSISGVTETANASAKPILSAEETPKPAERYTERTATDERRAAEPLITDKGPVNVLKGSFDQVETVKNENKDETDIGKAGAYYERVAKMPQKSNEQATFSKIGPTGDVNSGMINNNDYKPPISRTNIKHEAAVNKHEDAETQPTIQVTDSKRAIVTDVMMEYTGNTAAVNDEPSYENKVDLNKITEDTPTVVPMTDTVYERASLPTAQKKVAGQMNTTNKVISGNRDNTAININSSIADRIFKTLQTSGEEGTHLQQTHSEKSFGGFSNSDDEKKVKSGSEGIKNTYLGIKQVQNMNGNDNRYGAEIAEKNEAVEKALSKFALDFKTAEVNGKEIRLTLEPENLGAITISVSKSDNGIHAKIKSEDKELCAVISGHIQKLVDSMESLGVTVSEVDVVYSQTDGSLNGNRNSGGEGYNRSAYNTYYNSRPLADAENVSFFDQWQSGTGNDIYNGENAGTGIGSHHSVEYRI